MRALSASELRIGNYHEYFVEDKVDERQEYWAVGQIDWQDIKIISDREERFKNHPPPNPPKEYYRAIPLTEEWLLKLGFEKKEDQKYYHLKFNRTWVSLDSILVKWYGNALGGIMMLDYVHQLQNIFYAINSEELELK